MSDERALIVLHESEGDISVDVRMGIPPFRTRLVRYSGNGFPFAQASFDGGATWESPRDKGAVIACLVAEAELMRFADDVLKLRYEE